jgi:hypothetical protein
LRKSADSTIELDSVLVSLVAVLNLKLDTESCLVSPARPSAG